jgi:hypothetical protein
MIRELLYEVVSEMDVAGSQHVLVVVGGSLLAMHGIRESTTDVDSVRALSEEIRMAVKTVGLRRGLSESWLNDSATPFVPRTLELEDCQLLFEHKRLRVLGAPLKEVFLMKLNRGGPQDVADMQKIWPFVAGKFGSAAQIVDEFYRAFPDSRYDEFLGAFVVEVLGRSGYVLQDY